MPTINVGDNSTKCLNKLTVAVDPKRSDSVVIKNVSGDTLSYFTDTVSTAAGTLTAGNSTTVTQPTWIQSASLTSVQLTGGEYGGV